MNIYKVRQTKNMAKISLIYAVSTLCTLLNYADGTSLFIHQTKDAHISNPRKLGLFGDFRTNTAYSSLDHRAKRSVDDTKKVVVDSLMLNSKLSSRFGETTIDSVMTNQHDENIDASFDVQLPETAFISNFTMVIDGVYYVAGVESKEEAERY